MIRWRCLGVPGVMRLAAGDSVMYRAMVDHFRSDERRDKPECEYEPENSAHSRRAHAEY
jgi:hypothetical protein